MRREKGPTGDTGHGENGEDGVELTGLDLYPNSNGKPLEWLVFVHFKMETSHFFYF